MVSPSRISTHILHIRSRGSLIFPDTRSLASSAMASDTLSENTIRYPRFPERYCDTAEGAMFRIVATIFCESPHLTISPAIAARIAGSESHTIVSHGSFGTGLL